MRESVGKLKEVELLNVEVRYLKTINETMKSKLGEA